MDDFYFKELKIAKYPKFCSVIKIVLTLRHGRADVEQGFSLNNAVLQSNMKHDSVVSKCLIQDDLVSNSGDKQAITFIMSTGSPTIPHSLRGRKKATKRQSSDKAREIVSVEIEELQEKVSALNKSSKLLD